MTDSVNWSNYIFPPLIVGVSVVIKDKYIDGYAFNDGVLLTDVGLHIVSYLLSDIIVQFGLNRMFESNPDSDLLKAGTDIVVQPALHGLMTGITRPLIHSEMTLIEHPINFFNSFTDGLIFNIVGKYLSSPLVIYFSK
jgi:hypothetical protein